MWGISSFSRWDWLQIIGTGLVIFGVIGELVLLVKKFGFNPTHFPPLESRKRRLEISSVVVLLLGLVLEIVALIHSLPEAARLNEKAESARKDAADAALTTQRLVSTNLTLRHDIVTLEQQMAERIQENFKTSNAVASLKPRVLTQKQQQLLSIFFQSKDFGGHSISIRFFPDEECQRFVQDIVSVLFMSGLPPPNLIPDTSSGSELLIQTKSYPDVPKAAKILAEGFGLVGFDFLVWGRGRAEDIQIVVGAQPREQIDNIMVPRLELVFDASGIIDTNWHAAKLVHTDGIHVSPLVNGRIQVLIDFNTSLVSPPILFLATKHNFSSMAIGEPSGGFSKMFDLKGPDAGATNELEFRLMIDQ